MKKKKCVYYVIGGPYVSDQAGLNRLVGEGLNPEKINIKLFWCHFVRQGIRNDILKIPMNPLWAKKLAEL